MRNIVTEKIKIWGIVQAVGFRPFIVKLAKKMNMNGQVLNVGGLVHIFITARKEEIDAFVNAIEKEKVEPIEIVHITREEIEYKEFEGFTISSSESSESEIGMIPPDLATCESCRKELRNNRDKRHRHTFISCMLCGPRYTIIDTLPYDRKNTTMEDFPMCEQCNAEYTSVQDRRFHAQTISCKECGPKLLMLNRMGVSEGFDNNEEIGDYVKRVDSVCDEEEILDLAAETILAGGIVAFKSVGGYNLVCDSANLVAERKLRDMKGREEKPFAIMFRDIDQIKQVAQINETEEKLLLSSARPIVLAKQKQSPRHLGVFLPSMAAQEMLLEKCQIPLIFTSCNISSNPIIKNDEDMISFFDKEKDIDLVVYNTRKIINSVDDSVVRVIDQNPQIIRRSKGYVPIPLHLEIKEAENQKAEDLETALQNSEHLPNNTQNSLGENVKSKNVLAMGGDLKSTFAISKEDFVYPSQYFGDMENGELQSTYCNSITNMKHLFSIKPDLIVCDKHPLYWTTKRAKEIARESDLEILYVQHHHAHIASVMAEHSLNQSVIGFSFDGTGYGDDGKIWGGEVLVCEKGDYERFSHLDYTNFVGGDAMAKHGWKSAISYLEKHENAENERENVKAEEIVNENISKFLLNNVFDVDISDIMKFGKDNRTLDKYADDSEQTLLMMALKSKVNTVESSSMGRLFDAVSALLGICGDNNYEGQAAIMLEDEAAEANKIYEQKLAIYKNESKNKCELKGARRLDSESKISFRSELEFVTGLNKKEIITQYVSQLCAELKKGYGIENKIESGFEIRAEIRKFLALKFHFDVSEAILKEAIKARKIYKTNIIALSGGVFQNEILMEESLKILRNEGFQVYYNTMVSPNDGGISLGQAFVAKHYEKSQKI